MQPVTLLFDQEIDIGLPLSGHHLIPGYQGQIGLPMEIYLQLYAVKGEERALIAGPNDLSRFVTQIDGEIAAWRFLRLFTAPETHFLFQKDVYTIDLEVSAPGAPLRAGAISPALAQRVGYQPPEMRREGPQYLARRDLVRADARNRSLPVTFFRRSEALAENGAYIFIDEQSLAELPRTDVIMPSYE